MLRFLGENLRWLSAGFLLTFMSCFGQTYFIALFSGEIRQALDLTDGQFGAIYGAATVASAFTLIWIGKVADRENLASIAAFVAVMLGLAAFGMATVAGPVALLITIYVLRLFGQGMMTHISQTAMGRWFVAQRGKALAISGFGFPTSEAMMPLIVVSLIAAIGWQNVWFLAAGVLILGAAPVLAMLLRVNRTPQASQAEADAVAMKLAVPDWTRSEVLRDWAFYALMPGMLSLAFIGTGILFHQVHLVGYKGWELEWFAAGFTIYAVMSVAFSFIAGLAVDRWSATHVLPFALVPATLSFFVLWFGTSPMTIAVFMVLFGMTSGMYSTTFGAFWPEVYGVRNLGAIRALAMAAMVFASAGSPFVLGMLIDLGVSFDTQLFAMASYMVLACVSLYVICRVMRRRTQMALSAKPA